MNRLLGPVLCCALVIAIGLTFWVYWVLHAPMQAKPGITVVVEKGSNLSKVLSDMQQQDLVLCPLLLRTYARITDKTSVRTGEYHVAAQDTPLSFLDKLQKGQTKLESFTIPEGFDRFQIKAALEKQGWMDPAAFDRLCDDPLFLKAEGIPGPTCEGYFFPDTYTFARGVQPKSIFVAAFAAFLKAHQHITAQSKGPLDLDTRAFATLASIVEKETGAPNERARIACVFYNRLQAEPKWKLQTDPTVIYAARLSPQGFDGNLTQEHLRSLDSPYNTYRVYGLPPGPIANPGRDALEAVANPDTCSDFFFVSKNNGSHEFCDTLSCHNRAVKKWQIDYFKRTKSTK